MTDAAPAVTADTATTPAAPATDIPATEGRSEVPAADAFAAANGKQPRGDDGKFAPKEAPAEGGRAKRQGGEDLGQETAPADEFNTNYRDYLPDDIKDLPEFKKHKDLAALAKSHVNLLRLLGGEKVPIPKPDDEAGWEHVYGMLGRPSDPDRYEFDTVRESIVLPEGVEWDDAREKAFRQYAHKHGLSQVQAQRILKDMLDWDSEAYSAGLRDFVQAREMSEIKLRRQYGDAYEHVHTMAQDVAQQYFGSEFFAEIEAAKLSNRPAFVEGFAKIARDLKGAERLKGATEGPALKAPVDQIAIDRFRHENMAALLDPNHLQHKAVQAQLTAMYETLHAARG